VRNQRKRVGRLRLLVAALVVTSISVVGAVGNASAMPKPTPSKGVLEICKAAAGDERFSGAFGFKVQGVDGVVQVPVGYCSLPIKLSPGTVTVTEVERPGYSVHSIAAKPEGRLLNWDTEAGTATVQIVAGGEAKQTMLTFTNKVIPKGYLEVCKAKPDRDRLDGFVSFTVVQPGSQPQPVSVRVGACSLPIQLNPGLATITEVANSGAQLVDIEVTPEDRLESKNLADRSVTVTIVPGGRSTQTMVTFINKKKIPPPTKGFVKVCKRAGRGVQNGTPFIFAVGSKGRDRRLQGEGHGGARLGAATGHREGVAGGDGGFGGHQAAALGGIVPRVLRKRGSCQERQTSCHGQRGYEPPHAASPPCRPGPMAPHWRRPVPLRHLVPVQEPGNHTGGQSPRQVRTCQTVRLA
jgi:hypothetical protein